MTASSRAQDSADRIYFTIVALIGGALMIYFASVPVLGLNVAFHFYLMLWIVSGIRTTDTASAS